MDKKKRIDELKEQLKEMQKKIDPSHCHDKTGYVAHSISPASFQEMEDLEEEIKKLENTN